MSGYKELITFQLADLIYQLTLKFLQTFGKNLSSRQKTQMEQAARSGKMNIAEGGFTEKLYRNRINYLKQKNEKHF